MEFANRLVAAVRKAADNDRVVNICLGAAYLALCGRSWYQQKHIDALEAEKESLTKSNKAMKSTMWSWKQQLFAEAATDSSPVLLARLKGIYGEASPPTQTGDGVKEDAKSPGVKLII